MYDTEREVLEALDMCAGDRIYPLCLKALSLVDRIDYRKIFEEKILTPIASVTTASSLAQFKDDFEVYGMGEAILALADSSVSRSTRQVLLYVADQYTHRIQKAWIEAQPKFSQSEDPRLLEIIEGLREYSGMNIGVGMPQVGPRLWPSAEDDQREEAKFAERPLQVPPEAELMEMMAWWLSQSNDVDIGSKCFKALPRHGDDGRGSDWVILDDQVSAHIQRASVTFSSGP